MGETDATGSCKRCGKKVRQTSGCDCYADRLAEAEALSKKAREAIASLPVDALGFGGGVGVQGGEIVDTTYPIRDELLSELDAFLSGGGE